MKKLNSKHIFALSLVMFFFFISAVSAQVEEEITTEERIQRTDELRERVKNKRTQTREELNSKPRENNTSPEKKLENSKKRALKTLSSTIKRLERLKNRVDKMKVIEESIKVDLFSKIDERISVLEAKKRSVEKALTIEELKSALVESNKEIKNIHDLIKDTVAGIHKTKLNEIITKLNILFVNLSQKAEEATGNKTSEMKELDSKIGADLAQARTSIDAGELKTAKGFIKKASKNMKKYNQIIKTEIKATEIKDEEKEGINE